jgi:hypothetical protein
VIASGLTLGNTIRKRMGLPPLFLFPFYFTPVLPLSEQSHHSKLDYHHW